MSQKIDRVGQSFGRLTVVSAAPSGPNHRTRWLTQCDCGSPPKVVTSASLCSGRTLSCGCLHRERQYASRQERLGQRYGRLVVTAETALPDGRAAWVVQCDCGSPPRTMRASALQKTRSCGCARGGEAEDLTGRRFGRLVALRRDESAAGPARWIVQCDCGSPTRSVNAGSMKGGLSRSCGCLAREARSLRRKIHGATIGGRSYEYRCWTAMRTRCNNPRVPTWKWYGALGVRVCERWDSYDNFLADIGPAPSTKHSLDRYPDTTGNYEPGNVRWATDEEQQNNTRRNLRITIDGVTKTLAEWCRERGVSYSRALYRLQVGIDPKAAISNEPIGRVNGRKKLATWRTGLR